MFRALIICNSIFQADPANLRKLNGPRVDGLYMWQALTNPQTSLFNPDMIDYLPERTHGEIAEAVEDLLQSATYEDVVVLYYSGHGWKSPDRELYLCGANTRTDRIHSTGVSCEALNKMMAASSARTIVVILDCCYGGAFGKGEEDIAKEFKGDGRYVLAAASAGETAPDAERSRQPSPFTAALADALYSGDFGENDLDSLFERLSARLTTPKPQRSFDGSGSPMLARRPATVTSPVETMGLNNQDLNGEDSVTAERPVAPGSLSRLRVRARHDISYGDLASWAIYLISGLVQLIFSAISFEMVNEWSDAFNHDQFNYVDITSIVMPFVYAGAIGGLLTCIAATGQHIVQRRALRGVASRRVLLLALGKSKTFRIMVGAQRVFATVGGIYATAFLIATNGFDNPIFTVLVAAIILPSAVTIISLTKFGDEAFLAGSLVFVSGFFLPADISSESVGSNLTIVALLTLLIGVAMVAAWLIKMSSQALASISIVALLPIAIGFNTSEIDGPSLSLVGAIFALFAALLGCGVPVADEMQSDRLRPLSRLVRAIFSATRA